MYNVWYWLTHKQQHLETKGILAVISIIIFSLIYMFFDNNEFSGLREIKNKKYSVENYFDRLYYSTIIQTSIGIGDIYPATEKVRIVTMIQALSTILIILT